ncbi:MAG: DUF1579 domain-containing protein [Phycisphaerae bacterium]|jgi:hypothetical protein|nr:DUF1579 domain-containing protein [Phycisphaerae bacterium]
MQEEQRSEHQWLEQLVGEWTSEVRCRMGPDQPELTFTWQESVRSLRGLWILCEGTSEMSDGSTARTVMTLGFDPRTGRFVGTYIGSMMTHLWVYDGGLDAGRTILTLDTNGPGFGTDGAMARFQDTIELHPDGTRELRSQYQDEKGEWHPFMQAIYRRVR